MSRRDDYPGHNPGSAYLSDSGAISAVDRMPPTRAASSADANAIPQDAPMTTPLYEYPPDGRFYQTYPTFFGFSGAVDQSLMAFSPLCQTDNSGQYAWDRSLVDVGGHFPRDVPAMIGSEGNGVQALALWDQNKRTNPPMMSGDAMAMASPMAQYVTMESMPGISGFEPLQWLPRPMGPVPLSPSQSQSSHYTSSPCSNTRPNSSRNNSYSSLPTLRANSVAMAQLDAQFESVREHAASPGDNPRASTKFSRQESSSKSKKSSSARQQKLESRKMTRMDSTATAGYNGGALASPAVTPSPENSIIVIPDSPAPESQILTSNEADTRAERAPAQRPASQRQRNRAAATKCRVKTKLAVADLESTERAMSSQHQHLSITAKGLREEVLLLKNELLSHGNCDDSLIQQYLANQARMVGNGVLNQHQYQQEHEHGRCSFSSSRLPSSTPSPRALNGGR